MKNRALHHGIKCSPYESMFGIQAKIGLKSIICKLKTEEDLETAINSIENVDHIATTSNNDEIGATNNVINNEEIEDVGGVPLRIQSIHEKRNQSLQNLKIQANKMKQVSESRFCRGEVGESVTVKIPDVDRARSDFRNIIGIILSVNDDNMYEIGTTEGRLSNLYSRNQFVICKESFLNIEDVPQTVNISMERLPVNFPIYRRSRLKV